MCHKLWATKLSIPVVTVAMEVDPMTFLDGPLVPQATGLWFLAACETRLPLSGCLSVTARWVVFKN